MGLSRSDIFKLPGNSVNTVNKYDEAPAVVGSVLTTIVSYTVTTGKTFYLKRVEMGGENIASYDVLIDGIQKAKRRTGFGGKLTTEALFDLYKVAAGSIIEVKVFHERPVSGDFEGRISGYEY